MRLADVNVFVGAFRPDSVHHTSCRRWLDIEIASTATMPLSTLILGSFVRVATNPHINSSPSKLEEAIAFCSDLLEQPHARLIEPTRQHWTLFTMLCRTANASGNLVTDAWIAALAIDHNCELISLDRDFAKFPGLRWRRPQDVTP